MKYIVEVKEILSREISIEAESKIQAENKVRSQYWDGDIKLTSNDCIESSIICNSPDDEDKQPTLFD